MKSRILTFILFTFTALNGYAQFITGEVTNIFGDPLVGANVYWSGTQIATTTDQEGTFTIQDRTEDPRFLVFSYVGFKTDSVEVGELEYWSIQLIEDSTLPEVDITAKEMATRYEDTPAKMEVIGTRELERSACCSLAGCFNTNASVDAQTTNAVTDATELRILGLSGIYNQLLIDGMPLFEGLAYTYGVASIPGTLIENIYVSKGANSILQGYSGITGQINIIPRSVEKSDDVYINAYLNSFGESQYNAQFMHEGEGWSNLSAAHLTLPSGNVDGDGDGFQDVAQVNRLNLYNKWTYDNPDNPGIKSMVGLRFWNEKRTGGQLDYDPDKNKGSSTIYGQVVDISQADLYGQFNYLLSEGLSMVLLGSGYYHDQESYFGEKQYIADQLYLTTDVQLDYNFGASSHNLKFGASLKQSNLNENISFTANPLGLSYAGVYDNDYTIPGLYAEGTFYLGKFSIISGLRTDHHPDIGWQATPRMLLRAELSDNTDVRLSVGKGFRRVHLFPERVNLLASNRDIIIYGPLLPEEAVNIGLNLIRKFHAGGVSSSISLDGYITFFQNQVIPDFDMDVNKVYISNVTENGLARSLQVDNNWEFSDNASFKISYKYLSNTYESDGRNVDMPLIARHNILSHLSLSTSDDTWQVDVSYRFTGKQRLPDTQQYPEIYRQEEYSPGFSTVDLQITRRWEDFEIYTGVENILGKRQEFPFLSSEDPFGPYFDSSFNWGPTQGSEIYFGARYKFNKL